MKTVDRSTDVGWDDPAPPRYCAACGSRIEPVERLVVWCASCRRTMPAERRLVMTPMPGPLPTPCHLFVGPTSEGYGRISTGPSTAPAHRVAYEFVVGPVPDGLVLDHCCANRACINTAHLQPVTMREFLRGARARKAAR